MELAKFVTDLLKSCQNVSKNRAEIREKIEELEEIIEDLKNKEYEDENDQRDTENLLKKLEKDLNEIKNTNPYCEAAGFSGEVLFKIAARAVGIDSEFCGEMGKNVGTYVANTVYNYFWKPSPNNNE